MDAQTFLMELLLVVMGGVITVAIAYGAWRLERNRNEAAGLQLLLNAVAHKRALRPVANPTPLHVPEGDADYAACTQSILNLRDVIQQARSATRIESKIHPQLDLMTKACNGYLTASRHNPSGYVQYLMTLRTTLAEQGQHLVSTHKKLRYSEPGTLGR